jgi:RsiW-degrading membrane proteinase PrsW (M82 family)
MELFFSIVLSLAVSVLPALLWLWFWLHEDRARPEPRKLILFAFLAGMTAVVLAFVLEQLAGRIIGTASFFLITIWALIEEWSKYAAASVVVLHRKENDEPIDNVIYMISTALGFAALENTLFALTPIYKVLVLNTGNITDILASVNLRFVGSSLVHVMASSAIGIALAFAVGKSHRFREFAAFSGIIVATALHTVFNLFIIDTSNNGVLIVFSFLWFAIVVLILLLEKVKRLSKINSAKISNQRN